MKFGKIFTDLREKAGYSNQADLAREAGVTAPSISRIESEKTVPSTDTIQKLAPVLGVTPEYLLQATGRLPVEKFKAEVPSRYLRLVKWLEARDISPEKVIEILSMMEDITKERPPGRQEASSVKRKGGQDRQAAS